MNLHLYKVVDMGNCDMDNGNDVMDAVRVMTEKELRKEFMWAYNNGYIPQDLLHDYQQSNDYHNENWEDMGNLRIGTMIDIMNDICNYSCGDGYYIIETDVDVNIPRKLYEKLEEIQSICIGADSPDAHDHAERDPIEELQCCQQDIGAISNIVEEIQQMIGE